MNFKTTCQECQAGERSAKFLFQEANRMAQIGFE